MLSTGRAIKVCSFSENNRKFQLSITELEQILSNDRIKDREAVVISIAGGFRSGKSFLLNFFLKYLYAKYVHHDLFNDWMGNKDEELSGFEWRGGSQSVTTGIDIWSEVFLHDFDDGRKIAIILMDTQGTFDKASTMNDNITVFALSTLLSSVQIYNLSRNVGSDDLQHLQLFSEYGRLAAKNRDSCFQKLIFLIRDWPFPYEYKYGARGGSEFIKKRLEDSEDQAEEVRLTNNYILSCFDDISCYLMAFPGTKVTSDPNFRGKLSDIEKDFRDCVSDFVPSLLSAEKLIFKKINRQVISVQEFVEYFKTYSQVFASDTLPTAMTIFNATADVFNKKFLEAAREFYRAQMGAFIVPGKPYVKPNLLLQKHTELKTETLINFCGTNLMGYEESREDFKKTLTTQIESDFEDFKKENERNSMRAKVLNFLNSPTIQQVSAVVVTVGSVLAFALRFLK